MTIYINHSGDGIGRKRRRLGAFLAAPLLLVALTSTYPAYRTLFSSSERDMERQESLYNNLTEVDAEFYASVLTDVRTGRLDTFLEERGYSEKECLKCGFAESNEGRRLAGVAEDLDTEPELVWAMAYAESRFSHDAVSDKQAYGMLQLTRIGSDEVWTIFNGMADRHKTFRKLYRDKMPKYAELFRGTPDEVWERAKSGYANEVAGTFHIRNNIIVEKGNVRKALADYNAGRYRRISSPGIADGYVEAVLSERDFFITRCPEIQGAKNDFFAETFRRHKNEIMVINARDYGAD